MSSDDEDSNFNRESQYDIEFEDEDDDQPSKILDDNNYLDINNENNLAVNLFPSGKKKMLTSQSIKNLKKKKLNQFLTSKSSIKRCNDDNVYANDEMLFVNGGTNLKKTTETDSMEFEQLKYDSNEKLASCGKQTNAHTKNVLTQSTNSLKNHKKLDTL